MAQHALNIGLWLAGSLIPEYDHVAGGNRLRIHTHYSGAPMNMSDDVFVGGTIQDNVIYRRGGMSCGQYKTLQGHRTQRDSRCTPTVTGAEFVALLLRPYFHPGVKEGTLFSKFGL